MSVFKDIIDIIDDVVKSDIAKYIKPSSKKSITKMSKEGVLHYPAIVSRSIDLETATMVNKALEREYVTVTTLAMNLNPILNVKSGDEADVVSYIKGFHQNSDESQLDMRAILQGIEDDTISLDLGFLSESYQLYHEDDSSVIFLGEFSGCSQAIKEANRESLYVYSELLNETKVNDMTARKLGYLIKEAKLPEVPKTPEGREIEKHEHEMDKSYRKMFKDEERHQLNISNIKSSEKRNQEIHSKRMKDLDSKSVEWQLPSTQLTNNDVKKANELIASLIQIRIRLYDKDKGVHLGHQDILVGVKCIMHPVTSEEVIDNIQRTLINGDKGFNFIRWTTGEIQFFKDFLFQIDDIKTDVLNRSSGRSGWWIALKRRKATKKIMGMFSPNKAILPNATIVVGMDEVTILRDQFQIDLLNESVVRKLMSELFLLGFVIVDDISKLTYFLFDGNKNFQAVSFSALERENSNEEKKYKEMLKLLNRSY